MTGVWTALGMLALTGAVSAQELRCRVSDNIGGCPAIKVTGCGASVYDLSFVIDRSGSMAWPLDGVTSCGVRRIGATGACEGQELARDVFRNTLMGVFNALQKPCLEFLESVAAKNQGLTCASQGYSVPRFSVSWFSSGVIQVGGQHFFGPQGQRIGNDWNTQFTNYFYNKDNDGRWIPNMARWDPVEPRDELRPYEMKSNAIEDFFFDRFMRFGDQPLQGNYPISDGGTTFVSSGLLATAGTLEDLKRQSYSGSDDTLQNAKFPVFLLTDGAAKDSFSLISFAKSRVISNISPGQTLFYGLGISGNDDRAQKRIFDQHGFTWKKDDLEFFFRDQDSTKRVIEAVLDAVQAECQDCYYYDTIPTQAVECVAVGAEKPTTSFEGVTDVRDERTAFGTSLLTASTTRVTTSNYYFKETIDSDTVYELQVPYDVGICKSPEGSAYVDYDENFNCKCCVDNKPCVCDFSKQEKVFATTTLNGQSVDLPVMGSTFFFQQVTTGSTPLAKIVASPSAAANNGGISDKTSDNSGAAADNVVEGKFVTTSGTADGTTGDETSGAESRHILSFASAALMMCPLFL